MMGWFWTAWGFVKSLGGGGLIKVVKDVIDRKQDAKTQQLAIQSTERTETTRIIGDYRKEENKYRTNRWIRPHLFAPFVVYLWAEVVGDTVLGLWSIEPLNDHLFQFLILIGGFYFGWRPAENLVREWMHKPAGERDWDAEAAELDKTPAKRRGKRRRK